MADGPAGLAEGWFEFLGMFDPELDDPEERLDRAAVEPAGTVAAGRSRLPRGPRTGPTSFPGRVNPHANRSRTPPASPRWPPMAHEMTRLSGSRGRS